MNIKEFVEKMADESAIAIPIEDGDYMGVDGLMYCGRCHTRKQTRVQLFGSERTVNCLCECGAKKRALKSYSDLTEDQKEVARELHPNDYEEWSYKTKGVEIEFAAK